MNISFMIMEGLTCQWPPLINPDKNCKALFFRCNGSTWALLDSSGENFCLLFLGAMSSVIFYRPTFSDIVFSANDCLTSLAIFTPALYSHGCQVLSLPAPKVPLISGNEPCLHWQRLRNTQQNFAIPLLTGLAFSYHLVTH